MLRLIYTRFQQFSLLRLALLSTTLLDEIVSGFPIVGLPLVRDQLNLSYAQIGLLLSIGGIVAIVLEPMVNLLSDRTPRRYWILGGLLTLALTFILAGNAPNFIVLLLAFALISPASDAALGQSEATLIDQNPQNSTQTMTHWTLMGAIGDLLAPLTVTLIVSMHMGWSALCWLGSILWLAVAGVIWSQRFPRPTHPSASDSTPQTPLLAGLREALRDPVLLRWATLSLIPAMVDEVFLGFVALYLHDVLHANQATIGLILAIQMGGALFGLFVLDRLLLPHFKPHSLLTGLAWLALTGMIGLLTTRSLWFAAAALFVINTATAGWFPIAQGQAYLRFPGRAGTVRTVNSLLGAPLVALPWFVGVVAGQFGVVAGVGMLGLAPILVLVLLIGYRE
jgi:predicted MFS family arabinose efflux permease